VGGISLNGCGGVRIGIYSGIRGGGCILIGGRGRRWGFDLGFMSVPVADDPDGRRYDIGFLVTTGFVLYNPQRRY
jgi:hypothetical protein